MTDHAPMAGTTSDYLSTLPGIHRPSSQDEVSKKILERWIVRYRDDDAHKDSLNAIGLILIMDMADVAAATLADEGMSV